MMSLYVQHLHGKYCKLPGDIELAIVNNELAKQERCATCKGRKSVILCGYMHAYNVASYLHINI